VCGIVGFFENNSNPDSYPEYLFDMLIAIEHRGPDELGIYFDNHVGLGSARLSIIDIENGQQPMQSMDSRYVLTYNGELFNYKEIRAELEQQSVTFRTKSDTEVVLSAMSLWGVSALNRFNGQFAFALLDRQSGDLLLVRDRTGERPLYYKSSGSGLYFSSEIKGLKQHPNVDIVWDAKSVSDVFTLWTNIPGDTCYKDIQSLPSGCYGLLKDGKFNISRYYSLPINSPASEQSFEEQVDEVKANLTQAVKLRLRSDVPLGVFLSGGLDSTIITGLACSLQPNKINSYAVEFENQEFDETEYQMESAQYYGTNHKSIRISGKDIVNAFPAVVRQAETIQFRSASVPMFLLAQMVKNDGIKVVLTGEGADEAFLGYDIFKEVLFRSALGKSSNDEDMIERLSHLYPYIPLFDQKKANQLLRFFRGRGGDEQHLLYSHDLRFSLGHYSKRLLREPEEGPEERLSLFLADNFKGIENWPAISRAQAIEYSTLLEGYLLSSQGDRMMSAHSIEGRAPFLDNKVMEGAFRLPRESRLKNARDEKHILKKAFADMLPASVVRRNKQPYRAPDCKAFISDMNEGWLQELFRSESISDCALLNAGTVQTFLKNIKNKHTESISAREDQTFMLIASLLELDINFVKRIDPHQQFDKNRLSVFVDGRSSKA
jgi:asparagine synthase (glutamine-hydrolysing)